MKVLVSGGAGFIGSHIVDSLITDGHTVHIIDDLSGGFMRNLNPKATFHKEDIRSEEISEIWKEHRFEVLIHCGAQMDVRRSVADPSFDADVNVIGFLNLMEAGRHYGLKKVVFSSTGGAIYGEPEYVPQDEKHPTRPMSPYGITKLTAEHYLAFYKDTHGIDSVILRYANVYGPRQNAHGEAGVVAIFTERMLANTPCFINGDGGQTRDYVYVGDVVQANMKALDYKGSNIFNVGTGIETSVLDLFLKIKKVMGSDMSQKHADAKPGEQQRSVVGTEKIENELGWERQFDLDTGLTKTVNWFKDQEIQER
ncbi:MAG: NAD-dependent epimerase/dehydratase family protein [Balneolales bacterium]